MTSALRPRGAGYRVATPVPALLRLFVCLSVLALAGLALPAASSAKSAGKVKLSHIVDSDVEDTYLDAGSDMRTLIKRTYKRLRGYPPAFDSELRWAPKTWAYKNFYAIYNRDHSAPQPDLDTLEKHPDWVLRDDEGRPLFINWECSGECTQYAADFGNPAWRNFWIKQAKQRVRRGYKGIHIDDINLSWRISNGNGYFVKPWDPRTNAPMTLANWKKYMADFAQLVAEKLPKRAEIVHNAVWFFGHKKGPIRKALMAADIVALERGFNDKGLVNDGGKYSIQRFLRHIDWLHRKGKPVILQSYDADVTEAEYELAGYFLISNGKDMISPNFGNTPGAVWKGWRTNLGKPLGKRHKWRGMYRRNFTNGQVLLNPPDTETKTVTPSRRLNRIDGSPATTVTLGPRQGAVLVR